MSGHEDRLGDYVDVAERIRIFRDKYPAGSLQPLNLEKPYEVLEVGGQVFVVYVAAAYRDADDPRPGIGMAWEPFPGRTPFTKGSELMVAETSAWGRAIIATLAADSKKVASLDEVRARRTAGEAPVRPQEPRTGPSTTDGANPAQKGLLRRLAHEKGFTLPDLGNLSKRDASDLIDHLKTLPDAGADQEEPF